jgi:hypothetical protein
MPNVSRSEAIHSLIKEVNRAKSFDLREYYLELNPGTVIAESNPKVLGKIRTELLTTIQNHLLDEQLVDLWNIAFPERHCVYYDDELCELEIEDMQSASVLN